MLPVESSEGTHMTIMLEQGQKMLRGELSPPPIARLLGFVVKAIEPGHAVFEMAADERHHNPMGTLHGGIYCDLADAAMGYDFWNRYSTHQAVCGTFSAIVRTDSH